ncbi:MAG: hypothetical protein QOF69_3037 [Solirubrobacteraceae bacterium]|nr:hypothetical protein [Solirubrobacteraceae bacterium]
MQQTSKPGRVRRIGAIAVAAVLTIFGVVAIAQGLTGRSTVHRALQQEAIVGLPYMTPTAIAPKAKEAGLRGVTLPTCSVAGKPVDDAATARCFAEYMRIDALMLTGGATYSQLPPYATKDGKGTSHPARAQHGPDGKPVTNPSVDVWVTETALSTALNTSYMAEQISLFGVAVGVAFLLVGVVFGVVATAGRRNP